MTRIPLIATSLVGGVGIIAEGQAFSPPVTAVGWLGVATTLILAVQFIADRRKIARSETSSEIIKGKDELIAHLEEQLKRSQDEAVKFEQEFQEARNRGHTLANDLAIISNKMYGMQMILVKNSIEVPDVLKP